MEVESKLSGGKVPCMVFELVRVRSLFCWRLSVIHHYPKLTSSFTRYVSSAGMSNDGLTSRSKASYLGIYVVVYSGYWLHASVNDTVSGTDASGIWRFRFLKFRNQNPIALDLFHI